MMNWNRVPNNQAAGLAHATIALYSNGPSSNPSFSSIGGDSTYPQVRFITRLFALHIGGVATLAAKAKAGLALVLPLNPRFYFKAFQALGAIVHLALNRVNGLGLLAGKGVRGAQASTPIVAKLVVVRHQSVCHVPFAATCLTAKPRGCSPVLLHLKSACTYLANFRNHADILARNDRHCRIEQAVAQGQLFEPERTKQVQEALI
jgi:hypothetical protein